MKKIFLVRHGESAGNAQKYVSFSHTPLTEKGHRDALKLGERLVKEKINIDVIYCSSLYRTLQTMEDILKADTEFDHGKVRISDLIREINRKEFEGRPREEYYAKVDASGVDPDNFCCEGGESENDVKKRAKEFLKQLEEEKANSIMVITHGHFINNLTKLLGLDVPKHMHGVSLSLIELEKGKAKIIYWDDTSHLS